MAAACSVGERALVTGATGFVGSHLVRRLAAEGMEVHALVRRAADDARVQALGEFATSHRTDGTTGSVMRAVAEARPTIVFHLAARFVAEHQAADVEPLVRDNLLFGVQLLEAMHAAGVTRLVNVGSPWQHFENRDYSPVNLYAATKQAFADLLAYYVEVRHFRAVTLELTDSYGAGDPRQRLLPAMRAAERDGRELSMVRGDWPVDLVHVDDAIAALLVASRRVMDGDEPRHEIFAARSNSAVTVFELFESWERARGVRIAARWGERPFRGREVLEPWTQGTPLPGWHPRVTLADGLRTL